MTQYILSQFSRKTLPNGAELINTKVYEQQKLEDVTIWKTDSKGVEFPNFDNLKEGDTIEANFWRNPTSGKASLYPIKDKPSGAYKPKQTEIKKAMEDKRVGIEMSQDRKEHSIKVASTASGATQILVALMGKDKVYNDSLENWEDKWLEIRDFLWSKFETENKNQTPF